MKKQVQVISIILLLSILVPYSLNAQVKKTGLPLIQNFKKGEYNGDTQNWNIIEDSRGYIYAANNNGVLQFDGDEWYLYKVNNNSIVRSLALGADNNIYVGAYNEFGSISADEKGYLKYSSLSNLVPKEYNNFDDVWGAFQTRYGIIFQSFEYLFIYGDSRLKVHKPVSRFGFGFYVNNNYYIIDKGVGLQKLNNNKLITVSTDKVFIENEIRFILPYKNDNLLIGTISNGLYILQKSKISSWECEANEILKNSKIFTGIKLNNSFAIGSINNGLYFVNEKGEILQHLNRQRGLQNNTILSLFKDRFNNLWLGLDNGIDLAKTSLPISILNFNYNIEASYTSILYGEYLYIGTNQGLYALNINDLESNYDAKFAIVENSEGQVWNLSIIDNQLFCAHNKGASIIKGLNSNLLYNQRGVWGFTQPKMNSKILLCGTYDGIIKLLKTSNGDWKYESKISGVDISVRGIFEDNIGNYWVNHGYKGIYKLNIDQDFDKVLKNEFYNYEQGLPKELPYSIQHVKDQFFFSTREGIYQYNVVQDNFLRPANLNKFYNNLGLIYLLKEDQFGHIWYFNDTGMGVFKLLEDGNYAQIVAPFKHFSGSNMASYSNINVLDQKNIYIGTKDGMIHYNPSIIKDYQTSIDAILKQIVISTRHTDSVWYSNYKNELDTSSKQPYLNNNLPFLWNSVKFKFTSNDMENIGDAEFQYRLMGFSDIWTAWSSGNEKEYMNLREGEYTFQVQTKDIYGKTSNINQFCFSVQPPFYRNIYAYISYIIIAVLSILILIRYYIKRIEYARKTEKQKQEGKFLEKTEKLEKDNLQAEQELIRLRNEKLKASMKYKNKELANATFNLIQTNKFLNKIKDDLSSLSKKAKSEFVEEELRKISKKIDRDTHHEQNWKVFNRYFDEVHQEFINRLKTEFPLLTPKDLRLSGYLRMNISTKEIAPLLNISMRGVEISRYRLRKKLGLGRNDNLSEFLINY